MATLYINNVRACQLLKSQHGVASEALAALSTSLVLRWTRTEGTPFMTDTHISPHLVHAPWGIGERGFRHVGVQHWPSSPKREARL